MGGSGPAVPPGNYRVVLTIGDTEQEANFAICKDPRLATTQEAFDQQFALAVRLTESQSSLRRTVNGLRHVRRQLEALRSRTGDGHARIAGRADDIAAALTAIETELVDVHRETPRDVLRNPARHDDTLGDLQWTVAMADMPPATQFVAVADEVMEKVDRQVTAYKALVDTDIEELNRDAAAAGIPAIVA